MVQHLPTQDAAKYIGVKPDTLKRARWSNSLNGKEPPKGTQRGRCWYYRIADLDTWLAQFETEEG